MKDYSGYKTSPGVIVGIDVFKKLPTIVIAYMPSVLKWDSNANIEFAYLNALSTDLEICPMCEDDVLPNRETIVMAFDRAIADGECKMSALRAKKEFFLRQYGSAFSVDAVDMEASLAGETNAS
jgi:hypothetical protein